MIPARRNFLLWFSLGWLLLVSGTTWAAPTAKQVFDPYVGAWRGTFTVPLPDGTTRVIEARHEYEWDGNVLRGVHAFEEKGMLNYATSETFMDKNGRLFRKVSYTDADPSTYYGEVKEGKVTWLPTKVLDASRLQTVELFEKDRQGRLVMRVVRSENKSLDPRHPQTTTYDGRFSPTTPSLSLPKK
jgi:hypothetical protein